MANHISPVRQRLLAAVLTCSAAAGTPAQPRNAGQEAAAALVLKCAGETMRITPSNMTDDMPHDGFGLRLLSGQGGAAAQERDFLLWALKQDDDRPGKQRATGQGADTAPKRADGPPWVPATSSPMWTGIDALQRGNLQAAEALWGPALQAARRDGRSMDEAVLVNDLGVLEAARGRNDAALSSFQSAVRLFETQVQRERETAASVDKRLARVYGSLEDGFKQMTQQPLVRVGPVIARLNQASLLAHMGQRAPAEALLKQVLNDLQRPSSSAEGERDAENAAMLVQRANADLVRLYRAAGHSHDARAGVAAETLRPKRDRPSATGTSRGAGQAHTGFPIWLLGPAQAGALAGQRAAHSGPAGDAKDGCLRETMDDVARDQPLAYAEASQHWLGTEALRLEAAGDLRGAMDVQLRAALLAAIVRSPEREHAGWAALQRLALARSEPAVAVLYGKRAVNAAQALRGQIETLPRQARQAFLAERRRAYVTLAQTLLDAKRLAEAEAVLRLLKEDEGQPFAATAARPQRGAMPLAAAEAAWSTAFDALAARGRALHAERQALLAGQTAAIWTAPRTRAAQQELLEAITLVMAAVADGQKEPVSPGDGKRKQTHADANQADEKGATDERDLAGAMIGRMLNRAIQDAFAGRGAPREAATKAGTSPSKAQRHPDVEIERLNLLGSALSARIVGGIADPASDAQSLQRVPAESRSPHGSRIDAQYGGIAERLRTNLSITRRLDTVDADALALRQRLQPALAAPAALRLDATAQATLATGQQTLAALPAGTVAVYYLQGETRLDALVVDAGQRRTVRIDVGAAELAERIGRYRKALELGSLDLMPDATALYNTLWRPLGLAGSDDRRPPTMMLSLDGALRALPFAALHDGKRWLIERHVLNVYTSAAPAALTARPSPSWRIAAFGASTGGTIDGKAMAPLPAVPDELAAVVGAPAGDAGAQPSGDRGEAKLDAAFTAAALRQAVAQRTPVLHLASHFAFTAGDAQRSALLLGDGSALRLSELVGPAWRLDHVEQVTLSACQTALTGDDAFGQEVEGLATLLQAQGAAAVLATLWSVDDGSTAAFMAAMYSQRERDGLSRAEAVRQAQLKLLRGQLTPERPGFDAPRRSGQRAGGSGAWSHPLHWAPFVLMGNWL